MSTPPANEPILIYPTLPTCLKGNGSISPILYDLDFSYTNSHNAATLPQVLVEVKLQGVYIL